MNRALPRDQCRVKCYGLRDKFEFRIKDWLEFFEGKGLGEEGRTPLCPCSAETLNHRGRAVSEEQSGGPDKLRLQWGIRKDLWPKYFPGCPVARHFVCSK